VNIKWLALITVLSFIILFYVPDLDVMISSLFYDKYYGFTLRKNSLVLIIYRSVYFFSTLASIMLPASLFLLHIDRLRVSKAEFGYVRRVLIMLIFSLAIAPGILTHYVFKDHWGRSRPRDIIEFGGANEFTSFYQIVASNNKSFTSGHACFAFWTVGLSYLYRDRKNRRNAFKAGLTYGFIVSLGRIIQGGHFLSDVVTGGLLSLWTVEISRRIIIGKTPEIKET
jgi:lipid A 4'-phosphatase